MISSILFSVMCRWSVRPINDDDMRDDWLWPEVLPCLFVISIKNYPMGKIISYHMANERFLTRLCYIIMFSMKWNYAMRYMMRDDTREEHFQLLFTRSILLTLFKMMTERSRMETQKRNEWHIHCWCSDTRCVSQTNRNVQIINDDKMIADVVDQVVVQIMDLIDEASRAWTRSPEMSFDRNKS